MRNKHAIIFKKNTNCINIFKSNLDEPVSSQDIDDAKAQTDALVCAIDYDEQITNDADLLDAIEQLNVAAYYGYICWVDGAWSIVEWADY